MSERSCAWLPFRGIWSQEGEHVFPSVTILELQSASMTIFAAVFYAQHEYGHSGREIWRLFH